ncbi:hypothetical protein [Streptomyces tauricus]|uniref:hypothetical protein n=1 Tax=Streptomyces tauricus TaxID=68274 RepID=UPI003412E53A
MIGAVVGDASFACPTMRTETLLGDHVPVRRHGFADVHAPLGTSGTPPFPLGAPHVSELPWLHSLLPTCSTWAPPPRDRGTAPIGRFTMISAGPTSPVPATPTAVNAALDRQPVLSWRRMVASRSA